MDREQNQVPLLDALQQRLAQLGDEEKQAWANLNAVLGAAAELRRLISAVRGEPVDIEAAPDGNIIEFENAPGDADRA